MSYDLLVFDPEFAPRGRPEFMAWYSEIIKWGDERDYNSPESMTGNLRLFYDKLRTEFPPMNGPYAYEFDQPTQPLFEQKSKGFWSKIFKAAPQLERPEPAFDEAFVTDYSLAENAIYMGFAWSISGQAYNHVFNTALSAGVGFFNVSGNDGEILHDAHQFDDQRGL